ncbi:thymidylate synthase [Butyrivibrio sp. NC3005]|uniref:thymidylate synthase n=1 Tax=Butyrivibrio sp. NC3005 TaxID=1280685 RepID=UPI0003F7B624|nr:thymidylate synthase [Butyrivibrio sp. NC3005]
MSKADEIFISMCKEILENGTSTKGQKVRPHWEDGTLAYTLKSFGQVHTYDLSEEFPIMTLRKTALKSATDEMLWIYQKKSNNINDLNSHIWDEWADEAGSIGKAYGYQIGEKNKYKGVTIEGLDEAFSNWEKKETIDTVEYRHVGLDNSKNVEADIVFDKKNNIAIMDQMNKVIYDLKITPFSRRIMTTTWHVSELSEMNLEPCAYSMTYNVTQEKDDDKLTLNAILNQRSQDMLAANNWNIVQYAVLLHMLAQVVGMKVGKLVHVIADCHIYDRHIPLIKELIERTPLPAPKFVLNPDIKDFYDFTRNDVKVEGYEVAGNQITNIPIAI